MGEDSPDEPARKDHDVFQQLFRREHKRLVASLAGRVRDRFRAEDLAAIAFERAWSKRAQFRGESSIGTWLHAIGYNAVRESWRTERKVDPLEHAERSRYAGRDPLQARLESEEVRDSMRDALDRVPAKLRRLLVDHYVHGRPVRQIAAREDVPVGTVLSRLSAAREVLRKAWEERAPLDPMKKDMVRQKVDDAIGRLAADLKAGRSQALRDYLAAMGRFHKYSWSNALLIHAQRPTATRVAGYHTWRDLGRHVRRGEKGIMIYAPLLTKAQAQEAPAPGRASRDPEGLRLTGFRAAYVFDVAQTEGKPLPALTETRGDPQEFDARLKALVAERGITLRYDPSIAPADGVSSGGEIRLRPGLSAAEEFSVLTHELAHEMLHHGADRAGLPKVVRETQAEAVAYVVSRGIGLDGGSAAADYIALYNGDEKTLADSLQAVQETSSKILQAILPKERETPERAGVERADLSHGARADREPAALTRPQVAPDRADEHSLER